MIDFQSLRLAAALCRSSGSPEGCGKLAGDIIPGKPSHCYCALKGRWKDLISFNASPFLCTQALASLVLASASSVSVRVHPWLKNLFYQTNPNRKSQNLPNQLHAKNRFGFVSKNEPISSGFWPFKASQRDSKSFKAIQRYWEKIIYFSAATFVAPPINLNQLFYVKKQTKYRPIPAKKYALVVSTPFKAF